MTHLEQAVWGSVFAEEYIPRTKKTTLSEAAKAAAYVADLAVKALRSRVDKGRVHEEDDLELERRVWMCAEAGLWPEGLEHKIGDDGRADQVADLECFVSWLRTNYEVFDPSKTQAGLELSCDGAIVKDDQMARLIREFVDRGKG